MQDTTPRDARVDGPDWLRIVIELDSWPAPLGALAWLLRAAGAGDVVLPDDDPSAST
jgi:hypothetical protein